MISLHFWFNNILGGPVEINVLLPTVLAFVVDRFCAQKRPFPDVRVLKIVWLTCFTANLAMAFQATTTQTTLRVLLKRFWCTPICC